MEVRVCQDWAQCIGEPSRRPLIKSPLALWHPRVPVGRGHAGCASPGFPAPELANPSTHLCGARAQRPALWRRERSWLACGLSRGEGCKDGELRVLARADPRDFLGTRRLEEAAAGAYSWRNILTGWFRYAQLAWVQLPPLLLQVMGRPATPPTW